MRLSSQKIYDKNGNKIGSSLSTLNKLNDKLDNFTRHIDESVEAIENILDHKYDFNENEQQLDVEKENIKLFLNDKSTRLIHIDDSLKQSENRTTLAPLPLLSDFTETCRTLHFENARQLLHLEQSFAKILAGSSGKNKDVGYRRPSPTSSTSVDELEEQYCLEEGTVDVNSDRLKSTISIYSQSLEGMLFGEDRDLSVCQSLGIGQPLDRLSEETHDSSSTGYIKSQVTAHNSTICSVEEDQEDQHNNSSTDEEEDTLDETLDETLESNGSTVLAERNILKHLDITYLENITITNGDGNNEHPIDSDDNCTSLIETQNEIINPLVETSSQASAVVDMENDEDALFPLTEENNTTNTVSPNNSNHQNEWSSSTRSDNQNSIQNCERTNMNIFQNTHNNDDESSSSYSTIDQFTSSKEIQLQTNCNNDQNDNEIINQLGISNESSSNDDIHLKSNTIDQNVINIEESSGYHHMKHQSHSHDKQNESQHSQNDKTNNHYKTPLNTHVLDRFQVQVLEGGSEIKVSPIEDGVLKPSFFQSPIPKSCHSMYDDNCINQNHQKDDVSMISHTVDEEVDALLSPDNHKKRNEIQLEYTAKRTSNSVASNESENKDLLSRDLSENERKTTVGTFESDPLSKNEFDTAYLNDKESKQRIVHPKTPLPKVNKVNKFSEQNFQNENYCNIDPNIIDCGNFDHEETKNNSKDLSSLKKNQSLDKSDDENKSSFTNQSRDFINDCKSVTSLENNTSKIYEGPLVDKQQDEKKVYRKTPARKKVNSMEEFFQNKEDEKINLNCENESIIDSSSFSLCEQQAAPPDRIVAFQANTLKDITNLSLNSVVKQGTNISNEVGDLNKSNMQTQGQTMTKKSSLSSHNSNIGGKRKVYTKTPVLNKTEKEQVRNNEIHNDEKQPYSNNVMIPALKKSYLKTTKRTSTRTSKDDCSYNNESSYTNYELLNSVHDEDNISSKAFDHIGNSIMTGEDLNDERPRYVSRTGKSYPRSPVVSKPLEDDYNICQTPEVDANRTVSPTTLSRTPKAEAWIKKHMNEKDKKRLLDVLNNSSIRTSCSPALSQSSITTNKGGNLLDSPNESTEVRSSKFGNDVVRNDSVCMSSLKLEEYDAAPRVVKMQVSLEEVNVSINLLNEWINEKNFSSKSMSESDANHILENDFHNPKKRKFILLSLCHWKRLILHIPSGGNERHFIISQK